MSASRRRFFRPLFLCSVIPILLLEIGARLLLGALGFGTPQGFAVVENPEHSPRFVFNPVGGYSLSREPFRWAVFEPTGKLQSLGIVQGNNLGFHDPEDFTPAKRDPGQPRIAVLGDSMSAGIYLEKAWPQRLEEISQSFGRPVDVMNFAVDGGGVMNWWCIVNRLLLQEDYELDGIVIAVCCDDLTRGLFIRHDEFIDGQHRLWCGRVRGMTRNAMPSTLEQARTHALFLGDDNGLSHDDFERQLTEGKPKEELTRSGLVTMTLLSLIVGHFAPQGMGTGNSPFSSDLLERIHEMRDGLARKRIPILVVQVPMPTKGGDWAEFPTGIDERTRAFSSELHATLLAGGDAFRDLAPEVIESEFLVGDPHWNQKGSDRFAAFLEPHVRQWLARFAAR